MKKIKNWFRSIKDIVVNPRRFFSKIVADGDIEESMLKAFIYGLLGGLAVLGIKLIGGATITINSVFTAVIIVPVIAVALLFIGGMAGAGSGGPQAREHQRRRGRVLCAGGVPPAPGPRGLRHGFGDGRERGGGLLQGDGAGQSRRVRKGPEGAGTGAAEENSRREGLGEGLG